MNRELYVIRDWKWNMFLEYDFFRPKLIVPRTIHYVSPVLIVLSQFVTDKNLCWYNLSPVRMSKIVGQHPLVMNRYTVKKSYWFSRLQPGCHLTNSPWPGIINLFPPRGSLVSDIPSGEGKTANLFLQCIANSCVHALPALLNQMCEAWSSSSSVLGSSSSSPTLIMAILALFSPHFSKWNYVLEKLHFPNTVRENLVIN